MSAADDRARVIHNYDQVLAFLKEGNSEKMQENIRIVLAAEKAGTLSSEDQEKLNAFRRALPDLLIDLHILSKLGESDSG
jgi:hypothetical protein